MLFDCDGVAPRDEQRAQLVGVDGLTFGGKRRATAFSCTGLVRAHPAWADWRLFASGVAALVPRRRVRFGAEGRVWAPTAERVRFLVNVRLSSWPDLQRQAGFRAGPGYGITR